MGFISKMLGWDKKSSSDLDSGLDLGDLDDTLGPRQDFSNNNDPFATDNQGFNNKPNEFQGSNDPFSTAPQNYNKEDEEDFRFGNKQQDFNQNSYDGKDLQLVIEKLDTIKSSVNSLHHRLDKLEQQKSKKRW